MGGKVHVEYRLTFFVGCITMVVDSHLGRFLFLVGKKVPKAVNLGIDYYTQRYGIVVEVLNHESLVVVRKYSSDGARA